MSIPPDSGNSRFWPIPNYVWANRDRPTLAQDWIFMGLLGAAEREAGAVESLRCCGHTIEFVLIIIFLIKWPYWGMYPIFRHTLVNMIAWVITCTLTFTTSTVKLPGWGLMWVGAAQVLPQALSMKIFGLVSCKHADLQAGVSGNGVYYQKASIIGQWWFTNGIGIALFAGKHKVSSPGQIKLDSASQLRVVPLIG